MTGLTVEAVGQRLAASLCRADACAGLCTQLLLARHDAGVAWRAMHPATLLLSMDDAYGVARLLAQTRYRTTSSSDDNDT